MGNTVKNYIKDNKGKNILVTKQGRIVAILCDSHINFGENDEKSILNAAVKKVDIVRGIEEDVYCIRLGGEE